MLTVAFDVDGTLITYEGEPKKELVELAKHLTLLPDLVKVIIWSGGGKGYAEMQARRLGFDPDWEVACLAKTHPAPYVDIAIDDMPDMTVGKPGVLLKV